jgi:hypothetical protein
MNTSGSLAPDTRGHDTPSARIKSERTSLLCRPAEQAFKKGLAALADGETTVARALFEAAIQIERESGVVRVQPRFLSYYGLTLMERPETGFKARDYCLRAVREEFFNPDLFLNLSKVHTRLGERGAAYRAAASGLAIDPRHTGLKQQILALGIRRSPPLRFLDRSSSLNVLLGKVLHRKERSRR